MQKSVIATRSMRSCTRTRPTTYLSPILFLLPFVKWGLDFLGPLLVDDRQKKFVIMAVNYFTKWVEVEAVQDIMTNDVKSFI